VSGVSDSIPGTLPPAPTAAPTAVRAVRGAIQLEVDEREHVLASTRELVTAVLEANDLTKDDVISIVFTATPDVHSEFPAVAARELGMGDVPLMCTQELDIAGAMPLVIRLMAHVNTPRTRSEVTHIYLRGAAALRRDLAQ
jgi:chorismate mutase